MVPRDVRASEKKKEGRSSEDGEEEVILILIRSAMHGPGKGSFGLIVA